MLGGGVAGVTAAFELSATRELRERYQVTLYTPGWRLGGKGASGRQRDDHDRILEHGLHIWFGCYDNAFAVMQRCYAELGRPASAPLATWEDAFKPTDDVVLYEQWKDRWIGRQLTFPRKPFGPGQPQLADMIHEAAAWLEREWRALRDEHGEPPRHLLPRWLRDLGADAVEHVFALIARADEGEAGRLLRGFEDWVWEHFVQPRIDDDRVRFWFGTLDIVAASVHGIVADDLVGRGLAAVNEEELGDWLRRHGAREEILESSPILRGLYDGAFAYEDGDKSRPNNAAGKGLQDLIRAVFLYRGAILFKMQAGMGDTVFAPMYEVLRARGVEVAFFHWAARLGLSGDGALVDEIEMVPQVGLRDGAYDPLYDVKGLPCWPSEPLYEQLEDGERIRASRPDFEHVANPLAREPRVLRRGTDFDDVVLAIPPDLHREVAGEVVARHKGFAAMLDHTHSVMTQAFQLWIDRSLGDPGLDWPYQANSIMSAYVEPLDTYCNMTHLIPREDWPQRDDLLDLAYFVGVIPSKGLDSWDQANAQARHNALRFLNGDAGGFWPGADDGTGVKHFDWRYLIAPDGARGEARFDAQYWRANFPPAERYVTTFAGTPQYRLRADESGVANLYLAGDWTKNGLDAGCVEAAVTSGMLCSRAITGQPTEIAGIGGWLASDAIRPEDELTASAR